MALQDIDIRTTTAATPDQVWRLLDDSRSWPSWTPIETAQILEPAGRDGLGEVRSFTTGRVTVKETQDFVNGLASRAASDHR